MNRIQVYTLIYKQGMVPVFFCPEEEKAVKIAEACIKGGSKIIEMTNRGENALQVFKDLIKLKKEYPELAIGAGSISDAYTAALYAVEGADFIVGPVFDIETAKFCNSRKLAYIPGCATPTEVHTAEKMGAEICKIFPAGELGGPDFIRALRAPCPWSSLMPTGGVDTTEENLRAWFKAGVAAVGIGSKLISKDKINNSDFAGIEKETRRILEIIKKIREEENA